MSSQQRVHDLLAQAHADANLSVREYAEKAGLSHGTIGNYLAGRIPATIPDETLQGLSKAFRIPLPRLKKAHLADRGLTLADPGEEPTIDPRERVLEAIRADPELLPEAKSHLINQYALLLRIQTATPPPLTPDDEQADKALRREAAKRAKAARESAPKR